jgi:hypothetical protein
MIKSGPAVSQAKKKPHLAESATIAKSIKSGDAPDFRPIIKVGS